MRGAISLEFTDVDDPEIGDQVRQVWQDLLDDIEWYRSCAADGECPYDPEWDEWESEALAVLGES